MLLGEPARRLRGADVEVPGHDEAERHRDERAEARPFGDVLVVGQHRVRGQREDRVLPELVIALAEEVGLEDHAGEERARGQHIERNQHHLRRFMDVVHDVGRSPRLAVERHEDEPPGIEAGEGRRNDEHPEGEHVQRRMRGERRLDDRVLRDEARRTDRRERDAEAGERQRADDHGPVGHGNVGAQPAHAPHVLFVGHGVDDRAGAQEQQRLEEGVGEQVEDARAIGADAHGREHVAELRAGRVGDDPLDVVLHETDGRGEERRHRSDDRHEHERRLRQLEQRRHACDEEDARSHHGRGVDEGGDGRRSLHGVWQPGVQEELRRLAHRAHEEQQADGGDRALLVELHAEEVDHGLGRVRRARLREEVLGIGEDGVEIDRAEQHEDAEDAQREAEIADAVDDEGLDRGGAGGRPLVPEADQQIRRQPDAFPAEEQLQEVVRRHQHEHGEGEQRKIGEEARPVRVAVHVADRVDVHERGHGRHDDQHDHGERVHPQLPVDREVAGGDPAEHLDVEQLRFAEPDGEERDPGEDQRHEHQAAGDVLGGLGSDRAAEQARDDRAEQGQEDDGDIHGGSALHRVDVGDGDGAAVAVEDDEDGQTDRRFRGRHGQDEEGEHLADDVVEVGRERHHVEVHRQQYQLDRHQDDDDVLPVQEDAEHAEREQYGADREVVG